MIVRRLEHPEPLETGRRDQDRPGGRRAIDDVADLEDALRWSPRSVPRTSQGP